MGACISSHSSNPALGPPTQIPSMSSSSSSWTKNRREKKKKRTTKGNEAKGNDGGPPDRRPAISAASGGGGCGLAEEELHRVPGRLYLNGVSEVACLYTQQGKKGTNQTQC